MSRRNVIVLGILVLVAWGLVVYPVSTNLTRGAFVLALAFSWALLLWMLRTRHVAFFAVLSPPLLAAIVMALPGPRADPAALRERYLRALGSYQGVPYVWGGENGLGIDCSGLVRRAMMVAECQEALRTRNPALLRDALGMWAHDTSASGLMAGYAGRTAPLFDAASLNDADDSQLAPGDLAVTSDGVHTLAYLGDHSWIQADPGLGGVARVEKKDRGRWPFSRPVRFVRWKVLQTP